MKAKRKELRLSNGLTFVASNNGCTVETPQLMEGMCVKAFLSVIKLAKEMEKMNYLKPSFCGVALNKNELRHFLEWAQEVIDENILTAPDLFANV